jgi:hypothetical protein
MKAETYYLVSAVVGAATVAGLAWYVWETRRIAKAAIEQAEAVQTPCIVVPGVPSGGLHAAAAAAYKEVYERKPSQEASYDMILEGEPRFLNIGSGSALNILVLKEKKRNGRWEQDGPPGHAGSLATRGDFRLALLGISAFPKGDDVEYRLTITYESLSGMRYESTQTIENQFLGLVSFRRVGR